MATNAVIGALRVNLGLDSAEFSSGLKNATSRLDKFAMATAKSFAAISAAGAAMAGALAVGIKRTIDDADEMSKAASKFGVPVEELTRLKHAADLSGVSMEGLGTGLRKLSQNMLEASTGSKTAGEALDALGVRFEEQGGGLRSSTEVMGDIAERFSKMQDGAEKTAIAIKIFGRSGAELIPMLNGGRDGLAALMAEADALGLVLDQNTGRAAEAFNDNLTRLERTKDGLYLKITAQLLPSLEILSEKFLEVSKNGAFIEQMSGGLLKALSFISNEVAQLAILASRLSAEFAGLGAAFQKLFVEGDGAGAWAAFQAGQEKSAQMAADLRKQIEGIFDGSTFSQGQIARRIDDAFGVAGDTAGQTFITKFENATRGGARKAIDPMVSEAARIFDATRTPLEAYQIEIARLNELLAAGAISQDTYNRAVAQAQDAFGRASSAAEKGLRSMDRVGQSVASSLSSALMGLIDGTQSFEDALRGVLRQLANMALNSAFQRLFGGGGGGASSGGGASGGGGLFSGLFGWVSNLLGFANGGSFRVGGAGGIDSQVVAFRASPDETVSITKPGQSFGGGVGEVVVRGVFVDDHGVIKARVETMGQEAARAGAAGAVDVVKRNLQGWSIQLGQDGAVA